MTSAYNLAIDAQVLRLADIKSATFVETAGRYNLANTLSALRRADHAVTVAQHNLNMHLANEPIAPHPDPFLDALGISGASDEWLAAKDELIALRDAARAKASDAAAPFRALADVIDTGADTGFA